MKRDFTGRCGHPLVVLLALSLVACCACTKCPRYNFSQTSAENSRSKTAALNLNQASCSELEKLPGVGRALAERIVEHRIKYGPFRRVEHLLMVRGISETRFGELRPLIYVE